MSPPTEDTQSPRQSHCVWVSPPTEDTQSPRQSGDIQPSLTTVSECPRIPRIPRPSHCVWVFPDIHKSCNIYLVPRHLEIVCSWCVLLDFIHMYMCAACSRLSLHSVCPLAVHVVAPLKLDLYLGCGSPLDKSRQGESFYSQTNLPGLFPRPRRENDVEREDFARLASLHTQAKLRSTHCERGVWERAKYYMCDFLCKHYTMCNFINKIRYINLWYYSLQWKP